MQNGGPDAVFDGEIPTALSYRNELNVHKTIVKTFESELKSAHDPLSR